MNDLTIDDKNKLIAEFEDPKVNFDTNKQGVLHVGITHIKELRYHSSWSLLMPVCKKFDELDLGGEDYIDQIIYINHCDKIDHCVTQYNIELVYEAVVRAILWYNESLKSLNNL